MNWFISFTYGRVWYYWVLYFNALNIKFEWFIYSLPWSAAAVIQITNCPTKSRCMFILEPFQTAAFRFILPQSKQRPLSLFLLLITGVQINLVLMYTYILYQLKSRCRELSPFGVLSFRPDQEIATLITRLNWKSTGVCFWVKSLNIPS